MLKVGEATLIIIFVYLERLVSAFAPASGNSGRSLIVFPELRIDQSDVKKLPIYFIWFYLSLEYGSDSRYINNPRIKTAALLKAVRHKGKLILMNSFNN